jgi:hypothetical protein
MSEEEEKAVAFWECDKEDCNESNYRTLPVRHIIIEDECDFCGKYIKEPITKSITFNGDAIFSGLKNL